MEKDTFGKLRQKFFFINFSFSFSHSITLTFLANYCNLVFILEIDPHIIFWVESKKVNFNICYNSFLIWRSKLNDSCLKPTTNRMININSIVKLDRFGRLPLFENSARINIDELIKFGMPSSVMYVNLIIFDW